jgi:hypothetical protein
MVNIEYRDGLFSIGIDFSALFVFPSRLCVNECDLTMIEDLRHEFWGSFWKAQD